MWSWAPFRKSRFVIMVACRQLSLGRRQLGDLSYPLLSAAVSVSTQDKLRFPRRLPGYERYRRLSTGSPDHQKLGKGRDRLLSSWAATILKEERQSGEGRQEEDAVLPQ